MPFDPSQMPGPIPPWMMPEEPDLYGPTQPLQFPDMEQAPQFDPSQMGWQDRLAMSLHGALQGMPPVNPYASQGDQFGQSLLRGAVGGFIQPSLNRMQGQRQQMSAQQELARERNKANIQATLDQRRAANDLTGGIARDNAKPKSSDPSKKDIYEDARLRAAGTAAGSGDEAPNLSDEALNLTADMYAQTGQLPAMGMGKKGATVRTAIITRAAQRHPGMNLASNVSTYGADKASLAKLQAGTDQVIQAEQTALANSKVLETTINKIPDTGNQIGNAIFRPMLEKSGSVEVTNFNNALGTVQAEFARILNSGQMGNAPLTDAARKDLQAAVGKNFTKKQLAGALNIYRLDAHNRRAALEGQVSEIKQRINPTSPSSDMVRVSGPDGKAGSIHRRDLAKAVANGWKEIQ